MKVHWLLLTIAIGSACKSGPCKDDRGAPVQPRPTTTTVTPRTLSLADVDAIVWAPGAQATFQPTTSSEHAAISKLVPTLLDGSWAAKPASPSTWQADAAAAGFRIEAWTIHGESYWALLEATDRVRGAGAYIFRVAPRDRGPVILLQAPHAYHDLGTGELAAEMFFTPRDGVRPRALFTNTIHRYQLAPGDRKKRKHNPADVAHNPEHVYTVATEAFALAAGRARVIQVHGFGQRTDEDDDDAGTIAMVVSAGDKTGSSPLSAAIAAAAQLVFGSDVKRFPEEAKVLGATT